MDFCAVITLVLPHPARVARRPSESSTIVSVRSRQTEGLEFGMIFDFQHISLEYRIRVPERLVLLAQFGCTCTADSCPRGVTPATRGPAHQSIGAPVLPRNGSPEWTPCSCSAEPRSHITTNGFEWSRDPQGSTDEIRSKKTVRPASMVTRPRLKSEIDHEARTAHADRHRIPDIAR